MDSNIIYDDFYVAYFDQTGKIIFPSDIEEVKTIKNLLKNISNDNLTFTDDKKICYKIRIKRKMYDGNKVQIVELSNINEFIDQISNASLDDITHLNTRKMARNLFMKYIETIYETKENFAIILADLDGFKKINDTYGHTNGDIALSEVSRILSCSTRQEIIRESDIVARLGGDEFIIVLKNISKEYSQKRAEQLCKDIEKHRIQLFSESSNTTFVSPGTMSIGLYYVTSEEVKEFYDKGYTTDEIRITLLTRCDSALYHSKNNGKNQVTVYTQEKTLELKK